MSALLERMSKRGKGSSFSYRERVYNSKQSSSSQTEALSKPGRVQFASQFLSFNQILMDIYVQGSGSAWSLSEQIRS